MRVSVLLLVVLLVAAISLVSAGIKESVGRARLSARPLFYL